MIKKILKWTGIVLFTLIFLFVSLVYIRKDRKFDAPYPAIQASKDSAVIARGRHLVLGPAHCVACHGPENHEALLKSGAEISLTGGRSFTLPFGKFYVRNITPDPATGIGRYTAPEIGRILRYSLAPDGHVIPDFMPFHNLTEEDLTAVVSYLLSQKPVVHKVPKDEPNFLGNVLLAFLVKPQVPAEPVEKAIPIDTTARYGRYLAMHAANCNECHTRRNSIGEYVGAPFGGGGPIEGLMPPNISGDSASRLFSWSEQDFIRRFRRGRQIPSSHMPWGSFGTMSDQELKALFRYLKSVRRP